MRSFSTAGHFRHPAGDASSSSQSLDLKDTLFHVTKGEICSSCGVTLQTEGKDRAGYIDGRVLEENACDVSKPKFKKRSDIMYEKLYGGLSAEEKRLLMNLEEDEGVEGAPEDKTTNESVNENNSDGIEAEGIIEGNALTNTKKKDLLCLRCHNALYYNDFFDLSKTPKFTLDSIITKERTPEFESSIIYHVVSANDFPHSLNLNLFEYVRHPSQVSFIISKSDLIINHEAFLNKYGLEYFTGMINKFLNERYQAGKLQQPVQITKDQVFLVSSTNHWNVPRIYNSVLYNVKEHRAGTGKKNKIYFVGEANVGKSALIKALLYYDFYLTSKQKSLGARHSGATTTKSLAKVPGTFERFLESRASITSLKENVSIPGTFALPGTTQDILSYTLNNGSVSISDLPGYTTTAAHSGVYGLLNKQWIEYLTKPESKKLQSSKLKSIQNTKSASRYVSLTGKDCYSFAGLVFLVGPERSITQVRTNLNPKGRQFRDLTKALEATRENSSALRPFIGLEDPRKTLEDSNLKRYVIPPFFGSVDLVVKGMGYITIIPTKSVASLQREAEAEANKEQNKGKIEKTSEAESEKLTGKEALKTKLINLAKYNLYEFYAPAELDFYIRESIESYLYKKQVTRKLKRTKQLRHDKDFSDATGATKLKEKTVTEVDWRKVTKAINGEQKVYSKVIEVPKIVDNLPRWFHENYLKGKTANYVTEMDPETGRVRRELANLQPHEVEKEVFKMNVTNAFWNEEV